jgi:hypothetical protein
MLLRDHLAVTENPTKGQWNEIERLLNGSWGALWQVVNRKV